MEKLDIVNKRKVFAGERNIDCRKRIKLSPEISTGAGAGAGHDLFDSLPDDLVISVLTKLSSTASCPSDFINVLITYVILQLELIFLFFFSGKIISSFENFIAKISLKKIKNCH